MDEDSAEAGGAARDRAARDRAGRDRTEREQHDDGMRVRRAVLSDAHVDRAIAATTPSTEAFQDLITRYAWGEIWNREGLVRRDRSIAVLSSLIALHHWEEFEMHVHAARRNGLSDAEIVEVILQSAIYAGVPAANKAFTIARGILDAD